MLIKSFFHLARMKLIIKIFLVLIVFDSLINTHRTHALSFIKKDVQPHLLSSNTYTKLGKSPRFLDLSLQKGKDGTVDSLLTKLESVISNPITTAFLSFWILYALSSFGSNHDLIASKLGLSRQAINSWIPEFLDNSKNNFHQDNSEMLRHCLMMMRKNGAVGLQKPNFYHVFHYHVPVKKEHQIKDHQVHQMHPMPQVHQDNLPENVDSNQFWKGTLAYPHFNQLNMISKTNPSQLFTVGSDLMFNEHGNDFIQKTRFSDFKNSLENLMVPAEDDGNKDNDNLSNYERSESTAINAHQLGSSNDIKKVKTKKDSLTFRNWT